TVNAGYIDPPTATTGSTPFVEATAKRPFASTSKAPIRTRTQNADGTWANRGGTTSSATSTVLTPPTRTARIAQPGRSAAAASSPVKKIPNPSPARMARAIERRAAPAGTASASYLRITTPAIAGTRPTSWTAAGDSPPIRPTVTGTTTPSAA